MDNQQQQPSQSASLCYANCGFYGSQATGGFCSKCFNNATIKQKQQPEKAQQQRLSSGLSPNLDNSSDNTTTASPSVAASANSNVTDVLTAEAGGIASPAQTDVEGKSETVSESTSKRPNRCHVCDKRVGLTGFSCRCNGLFCSEHRYDNKHDCTFDYKTVERETLRKNNPVVKSEKVQRI